MNSLQQRTKLFPALKDAMVPRAVAACSGAMAVAAGAFGAHALKGSVSPDMLAVWNTAAQYHLVHSVALLAITSTPKPTLSYQLMLAGTSIFSGSLCAFLFIIYILACRLLVGVSNNTHPRKRCGVADLLVLTDVKKFGAITPIGGLLLIAGWLQIAREHNGGGGGGGK